MSLPLVRLNNLYLPVLPVLNWCVVEQEGIYVAGVIVAEFQLNPDVNTYFTHTPTWGLKRLVSPGVDSSGVLPVFSKWVRNLA